MLISADTMRLLLLADVLAMLVLAVIFLRNRILSVYARFAWGLLVVMVPLLGPFLVILYHPGRSKSIGG